MKINHIMFISKILTDFCAIRQKTTTTKKHFCKYCLQCFSNGKVLIEHRKTCLEIDGKQIVKLRRGLIKFKNLFGQLAATFKIYADFESLLKNVRSSDRNNNTSYTSRSYSL